MPNSIVLLTFLDASSPISLGSVGPLKTTRVERGISRKTHTGMNTFLIKKKIYVPTAFGAAIASALFVWRWPQTNAICLCFLTQSI